MERRPLTMAAERGDVEIVQALLEQGANIAHIDKASGKGKGKVKDKRLLVGDSGNERRWVTGNRFSSQ